MNSPGHSAAVRWCRNLVSYFKPSARAAKGTTHVACWAAAWMVDGDGQPGGWGLMSLSDFDHWVTKESNPVNERIPEDGRGLREWVEAELGCPVVLHSDAQRWSLTDGSGRQIGPWRMEPIYWVVPA